MQNKELMITLWNHCNNRCFFCYNRGYYHFPIDLKKHLNDCLNLLKSDVIKEYTNIRLVGGELFDGFIDKCDIKNEFEEILCELETLIIKNTIEKINIVTNLMYTDRKTLCDVLNRFDSKITLSTSYDMFGRFNDDLIENVWWQNIEYLQKNYPDLKVDIGINITEPFIQNVNKEWLDSFKQRLIKYSINFNELFTGIDNESKENCSFKEYFPKRKDFILFLQKLKEWNYFNYIIGTKDIKLMHYVFDKTGIAIIKDTSSISNQGYIDSNACMQEDIKRIANADW